VSLIRDVHDEWRHIGAAREAELSRIHACGLASREQGGEAAGRSGVEDDALEHFGQPQQLS
jgi:hypothetical protein